MHLTRSLHVCLTILTLVATVAAQARINAVTSSSVFSGDDNVDPLAKGIKVFAEPKNHPAAVASILFNAAVNSEFLPKEQGIYVTSKAYGKFVGKVISFPGFELIHSGGEPLELDGSLEQLKEQIREKYKADPIKRDVAAYVVVLDLASIPLKLSRGDNGEVLIDEQSTRLRQFTLRTRKSYLIHNSRELADNIRTINLDKFLDEFATSYPDDDKLKAWLGNSVEPHNIESRRQSFYPLRLRH
ncbi:hypothetical protein BGZ65_006862 [Modicella reniformis]|uniref:Uncharacterized protein n=1 Tax=Modicella reniformis TaxID=1440133 RepID=A0A9P6LTU0_9FUNG|nr:hypothetical protein BGZ65_006862 [Modicella reniformis]